MDNYDLGMENQNLEIEAEIIDIRNRITRLSNESHTHVPNTNQATDMHNQVMDMEIQIIEIRNRITELGNELIDMDNQRHVPNNSPAIPHAGPEPQEGHIMDQDVPASHHNREVRIEPELKDEHMIKQNLAPNHYNHGVRIEPAPEDEHIVNQNIAPNHLSRHVLSCIRRIMIWTSILTFHVLLTKAVGMSRYIQFLAPLLANHLMIWIGLFDNSYRLLNQLIGDRGNGLRSLWREWGMWFVLGGVVAVGLRLLHWRLAERVPLLYMAPIVSIVAGFCLGQRIFGREVLREWVRGRGGPVGRA